LKNVLATVVHLEGSSYRKPGVRMLIAEDLSSIGAVSGGCVEKEIIHRAKSVFLDDKPKIITYDGRYRLGCEGILYILIEPFFISDAFLNTFLNANSNRESLKIDSFFEKNDEIFGNFGSIVTFKNNEQFTFFESFTIQKKNQGWEIDVITSAKDSKEMKDFPGANSVKGKNPETIQFKDIHTNTAIVIMNHSYVQDLKYLVKLSEYKTKYIGVLGAPNRRERLFNELFEFVPDISEDYIDTIFTPAGLHIGAETPEEIAISIVAEILSVIRKKEPFSLRKLSGKIHS